MLGVVATPEPARATVGCTWAIGSNLALNCNHVYGSGLTVTQGTNEYEPGIAPENTCLQTSKWKYKKSGTSTYSYKTIYSSKCVIWPLGFYIDWFSPGVMVNGSDFCSTQKNSLTGYVYSPYACAVIKS